MELSSSHQSPVLITKQLKPNIASQSPTRHSANSKHWQYKDKVTTLPINHQRTTQQIVNTENKTMIKFTLNS